eukprot:649628-Prymnesium_polylepis.1
MLSARGRDTSSSALHCAFFSVASPGWGNADIYMGKSPHPRDMCGHDLAEAGEHARVNDVHLRSVVGQDMGRFVPVLAPCLQTSHPGGPFRRLRPALQPPLWGCP